MVFAGELAPEGLTQSVHWLEAMFPTVCGRAHT
jgi:hypothetical protein